MLSLFITVIIIIITIIFTYHFCGFIMSSLLGADGLSYPAVLPPFSSIVVEALSSDKIHSDANWRQFVLESAFFYIGILPTAEGLARVSYANIGRTMYEKFPKISAKGQTPWVRTDVLYFEWIYNITFLCCYFFT